MKDQKFEWFQEKPIGQSNLSEADEGGDGLAKAWFGSSINELAEHRQFETGATRDTDSGKFDYEGFLSPLVLEAYATFMHFNRKMRDGSYREGDNWQKGIPKEAYMKSGFRHFIDWWKVHRGLPIKENLVWALCGVIFNASGYLHEFLKSNPYLLEKSLAMMEYDRREGLDKVTK